MQQKKILQGLMATCMVLSANASAYTMHTIYSPNKIGAWDIVIKNDSKFAGAINSLVWRGKEFIESHDHGRLMQTAVSFSKHSVGHVAECFNPTEGGNVEDQYNPGQISSSMLEGSNQTRSSMATQSKMAFFVVEGQNSAGCAPQNIIPQSNQYMSHYRLNKQVSISKIPTVPHAIEHLSTVTTPSKATFDSMNLNRETFPNGFHYMQYENTAVYLKPEFNQFYRYDLNTNTSYTATANREYHDPVFITTASGDHAMGIYSPELPQYTNAGYGLFDKRNATSPTTKLNCVFRHNEEILFEKGYPHRCYVVVGNKQNVEDSLNALHNHFH